MPSSLCAVGIGGSTHTDRPWFEPSMMIKAHKIRLNPAPKQELYFRKAAGTARFVFNWALAEWKHHKSIHPGEEYGVMALKKEFNALKGSGFPWVYDVAKDVAEGAFTNLGVGLKNYFDSKNGKRKGRKVGFPKFKTKKNKRWSFRLNNDRIDTADHALYVPKLGWVNMAESLRLEGKLMGAVVSRQADRWYVSITVEMEEPEPHPFSKRSVGVDLGVKTLVKLSDGGRCENQALLRSELTHLKRLDRRLSRRQAHSRRWQKARHQLARFHERIASQRADYLHNKTTQIARTYRVIGLEDLDVQGMVRNHKLALSLADASFGEIRRQLVYKSQWFGGQAVLVGTFFPSSQLCSTPHCNGRYSELTLEDREWTCPKCGVTHDRDLNAARNIEKEALRILCALGTPAQGIETPVVATSGKMLVDGASDRTARQSRMKRERSRV
jgi:putative transposase